MVPWQKHSQRRVVLVYLPGEGKSPTYSHDYELNDNEFSNDYPS